MVSIKPEIQPTISRLQSARAIAAERIDPEGGDYGAGLIYGFSVIQRGEHRGHGMWGDDVFLQQVAALTPPGGAKAHYTHPDISNDGLGTLLGRVKNLRMAGDRVLGDLHILESAHDTPDGDLAGHVLKLAAEDSDIFGASIAYTEDGEAQDTFLREYRDKQGDFISPDPGNSKNLPHARMLELKFVDLVGDPAATDGVFRSAGSRGSAGPEVAKLLEYAVKLTDESPGVVMGIDADRARGYFDEFLAHRDLIVATTGTWPAWTSSTERSETLTDPAPDLADIIELRERLDLAEREIRKLSRRLNIQERRNQ